MFFWDKKQIYKYEIDRRKLTKIGFNIPAADEILK